jgi:hypothetical protein
MVTGSTACYCLTCMVQHNLRLWFVSRRIIPFAVWIAALHFGLPRNLGAESLHAIPLQGEGDYEFLFFSGDKKPEIDGLTSSFRELDPELQKLHAELKTAEADLTALNNKGLPKKKQRLEWSAIEDVTGYSVKLFDSKKNLIDTKTTEENSLSLELEPGEYFFQVAAVTKFKTGTYSRMTSLKVSQGKPGEAQLAAEERAEGIREKIKIQRKVRKEYLKTLESLAVGTANAGNARAELNVPAGAVLYLAINKKAEPYTMSQLSQIPGRELKYISANPPKPDSAFYWGAGLFAGPQDTGKDPSGQPYFRWNLGAEGFVRREEPYLKFIRPQLKLQAAYSPAKTAVFDSLFFVNLYPGMYFRMPITQRFSVLGSLSTGANFFMLFSSVGSSLVLQWGVMPAVELQYAISENLNLYAGGGINFTYDTKAGSGFFASDSWLKFVPVNLGITRRF